MALTAKMLGGLCLVALLVFNVTSMVGSNADGSKLSLAELMISAQADGESSGGGGTCDQCVVKQYGTVKYSCKTTPKESCTSPSKFGTTVSCANAKECN
ncbi:hypothetical protein [Pelobium manganitolerans]|uniref:hypothetical protein n=1 Tax=Pelobium manganitolerans TaxID=1842495 RepID=UPI003FA3537E